MPRPSQSGAGLPSLDNVGDAPAASGITAKTQSFQGYNRTVITLASAALTFVDNGATGAGGGLKVFDFPEGAIHVSSTCTSLTALSSPTDAPFQTGATTVVMSLGSTAAATDNFTLTTTEANFGASTSVGTLTTGAITATVTGVGAGTVLDGTATAVDLYLNLAADATNSVANGTVTVSGTIVVIWANLLDD